MLVSSYHGGTASSGIINIIKDRPRPILVEDILFVEDIIDTGKNPQSLKRALFEERNAASVMIATLLDKPQKAVWLGQITPATIPNMSLLL